MPTCNLCKKLKNNSDFYLRKNGNLRKDCKVCRSAKNSNYYKSHQDEIKKATKEYKVFNSLKIKKDSKIYYKENRDLIRSEQKIYLNSIHGRLTNLLNLAKKRSKGKPFDLDIDFLISLYDKQFGKCLLTNIDFSFIKPDNFRVDPFAISIDKINAKSFYTKDNVRLVCVAVNFGLNEFGDKIFKQICESYIENLNRDNKELSLSLS